LTETITERREEQFFATTFASDKGTSLFAHQFEAVDENQTRQTSWGNFRFHDLAKMTPFFTESAIKNLIEGGMQRFKLILESDIAGANH
jgi:hypothetical protein